MLKRNFNHRRGSQKNIIEKESIEKILTINKNEKKEDKSRYVLPIILLLISIYLQNILLIELIIIIAITLAIYKSYPQIKEKQRQIEVTKQLPYALRQISIELQAGIGLFDAMKTVASSDYGKLSDEFKITLEEIRYGTNYNEAFDNLVKRNDTQTMKKAVNQIKRTLNSGGNLSKTLNSLANENNENMKIKYKEYSEKLNSIMLIYMFVAVLIPVILFIMIIAATTVTGPIIDGKLLIILYLFFFPLVVSFMILIIKKMEPTTL
ncbi:type II secretion system F family protein [Methanosphaera sp. BMS]|uniref:type II secretion system F family protein n=1 Tax=Methanosphaera sp. BMS TaxID=1789762 RepID=UPI0013A6BEE1|nr:type II secretion system F family protein [Methanosphaera sp. BMS]